MGHTYCNRPGSAGSRGPVTASPAFHSGSLPSSSPFRPQAQPLLSTVSLPAQVFFSSRVEAGWGSTTPRSSVRAHRQSDGSMSEERASMPVGGSASR